jgi:outer membrane protein OmpA-like peptidoglycan-associated protein
MRNSNISLLFLIILISFQCVYSQKSREPKTAEELLLAGIDYYDIDEFANAMPYFQKADSLKSNDPKINYYIGECWVKTNHEARALSYLLIASAGNYPDKELDYALGIAFKLNHKFNEAIQSFENYKKHHATEAKKTLRQTLKNVERHIENCKVGLELIQKSIEVHIRNLGPQINSKFPDYVPTISADETELIFTSRRDNTTGGKRDPSDDHFFEDIYISHKSDTTWTTAVKLGFGINTETHDACVGLSPDGLEMYIYRSVKKGTRLSGDLYVSDQKGDIWTTPIAMAANVNSPYWEPSGSTTPDEKSFFFTSDRPGGHGGRDIYMVRKDESGRFGPAINLGPKINTEYDEDAPFIHTDGQTLYFSSKGHKTMGGFDIFHCRIHPENGSVITEPENIGYPINTADDDIYFVWSADGKRGYFSSDRPGGYGEKDIYVLERKITEAILVVLKGIVKDGKTYAPKAATITLTDNAKQKIVGVYNSAPNTGKFTAILTPGKNYGITVESPDHLFYSKNLDVPKDLDHYEEITDTILLQPIEVGRKIVLRNIFFNSNSKDLLPESNSELQNVYDLLQKNPDLKVMISAHSDTGGEEDYNMRLSGHRAKSVVDDLIKRGITKDRMVSMGFGEIKPMIFPDDTPEKRQMNRRVEFEITQ